MRALWTYSLLALLGCLFQACSGGPSESEQKQSYGIGDPTNNALTASARLAREEIRRRALRGDGRVEDQAMKILADSFQLQTPECREIDPAGSPFALDLDLLLLARNAKSTGNVHSVSDSIKASVETTEILKRSINLVQPEAFDLEFIRREREAREDYFLGVLENPAMESSGVFAEYRMGSRQVDLRYGWKNFGEKRRLTGILQGLSALQWVDQNGILKGRMRIVKVPLSSTIQGEIISSDDMDLDFWLDLRSEKAKLRMRDSDVNHTTAVCGTPTNLVWKSFDWDPSLLISE